MCGGTKPRTKCHFVPPEILKHIAEATDAPKNARKAAIRTLSADQTIRVQRVKTLKTAQKVQIADEPGISAAQAPIRPALNGPAARDETHDPTAPPLQLKRLIYDAKGRGNLPGTFVRGEGSKRSADRQVNNVYDGIGITVKFFHTVFGRNSLDGEGGNIVATVHMDDDLKDPLGYNNAFFNGTQVAFGDGDGIIFDHFTDSLDVVAHELVHAVTQYTAGIIYEAQAGGLNESISDVFAAMVEQWHFYQTAADADWLTGQSLFPVAIKGPALRDLSDPGKAYNDPILGRDRQVSHFTQYTDELDVHESSGIPNRAFYLIATGFGGFSWAKAGKIWYATLTDNRIRPEVTFKEWADVTVDQASRLFDISASIIVRNAWVAVGVLV